jgi:hypothetical protein
MKLEIMNQLKEVVKIEDSVELQDKSISFKKDLNSYYDPAINPMRSYNIHFFDSDS